MNRFKKLIACFGTIAMIGTMLPMGSVQGDSVSDMLDFAGLTGNKEYELEYALDSSDERVKEDGIDYVIVGDEAIVNYCEPGVEDVVLKSEINCKKVTAIGKNAFEYAKDSIKSVVVSEYIHRIGESAFRDCTELSVFDTTSDGVCFDEIGKTAFYKCTSLEPVTIKGQNLTIKDSAFAYAGMSTVVLSGVIESISHGFTGCNNLENIVFSDDLELKRIGWNAFANCPLLNNVVVPECVESIGEAAFSKCSGLSKITIRNKDCEIDMHEYTICHKVDAVWHLDDTTTYENCEFDGTICGYDNSTAQAYAENFGYKFELLDETPPTTEPAVTTAPPTTTEPTETSTTSVTDPTGTPTTTTTPVTPEPLWGDVNDNKKIDLGDAILIAQYLLKPSIFTDWQIQISDHNRDGINGNLQDVISIAKYLLQNRK